MKFIPTILNGSFTIQLDPINDERGWFARYFCKKEFSTIGHNKEWVQMNHSFSLKKGTLRGMHFQKPPYSEIKLVRCIQGSVFDVIIDLRKDSPTFLKWFGAELSAENKLMMYIPEGFAHGFQTLEDNSGLLYMHTAYYSPEAEDGLRYNDPQVNISWPLEISEISMRDTNHDLLEKFNGL